MSISGNGFGILAILIWSTLALLAVFLKDFPPFQILAFAFTIAFLVGLIGWIKNGKALLVLLKQPWYVWANGIIGLFCYHLFYFLAIRYAPPAEANLINYLWPLLIVLFSTFLPNQKLSINQLIGALLGFFGASFLILQNGFLFSSSSILGYSLAFASALIWATYSVLSRAFGTVSTSIVTAFCGIVALLSWGVHLFFEATVMPSNIQWFLLVGVGFGPVGGAFYLWDIGMKKGDIALLGVLAYFAPLLSTIFLVSFGITKLTLSLFVACTLIMLGSIFASKEHIAKLMRKYF